VQARGLWIIAAFATAALVAGCAYDPSFGYPVGEGNVEAGQQAFIDHQCHQCHSVAGVRLPALAGAGAPMLELGGPTSMVKSYAELMTSIINPNHAISERYREQLALNAQVPVESPMPTPAINTMTVRQLIDIIAFLDSRYVLIEDYSPL